MNDVIKFYIVVSGGETGISEREIGRYETISEELKAEAEKKWWSIKKMEFNINTFTLKQVD